MRLSSALLVLLALLVSGCGSNPAQEQASAYVAGVNAARTALTTELDELAAAAPPTSTPKSEAKLLLDYEKAVARAHDRVAALDPPAKVTAEHAKLLAALRSYELALGKARAAGAKAPASSIPAIREALDEQLEKAGAEVDEHVQAIAGQLGEQ